MGCSSSTSATAPISQRFDDKYVLGHLLGCGCYGQVYTGSTKTKSDSVGSTNRSSLQPKTKVDSVGLVAVKVVDLPAATDHDDGKATLSLEVEQYSHRVAMEVTSWRQVGRHNHCVTLHEAFVGASHAYFVMERCLCSISHMLRVKPFKSVDKTMRIFSHMLQGIAHVHSVGIVHRDVKPDNFLAGGCGGEVIKLCDFGLATPVPHGSPRKLGGTHGTPAFMSPEMLLGAGYDSKTDVWSMGAMCYKLLYGAFAYAPKALLPSEMKDAIRSGTPGPEYKWHGQCATCVMKQIDVARFKPFLEQTLQRDPHVRPTAEVMFTELDSDNGCSVGL